MSSFRRWYFYVVSAIALQAVTWAVIALLRNLFTLAFDLVDESPEIQNIAFQISVIIIGLPMFLLHWRWAGRSGDAGIDEQQENTERFLYLYFMLGAFLIPLLANAYGFMQSLLRLASSTPTIRQVYNDALPDRANLVYTGTAVFILALLLIYHARLLRHDRQIGLITSTTAAMHRLFITIFASAGLVLTAGSAAGLIQALVLAFSGESGLSVSRQIIDGIAGLFIMLPLWIYFWRQAQLLFQSGDPAELNSLLRKLYLYAAIFLSVLTTVSALTAILAGFLRRLLDLEPQSGSGAVISALVVGLVIWAYHAQVLREDGKRAPVAAEEAGMRRLYRYLVAGVGLLAVLVGLSGVLGVLFQPGDFIVSQQREQLAWFAAALFSGLVVWIIPWRKVQQETAEPGPTGVAARTSLVRRFYLFFFLLLATLTFLIAAVYILSRLLTAVLGQSLLPEEIRTMGLSAAYAIMAGFVWLYHGRLYQQDQKAIESLQGARAAAARIVVADDGDGELGCLLLDSLRTALPQSEIMAAGLTPNAAERMGAAKLDNVDQLLEEAGTGVKDRSGIEQFIEDADIIIGPWSMATSGPGLGMSGSVQAAIAASPARKLILPRPTPGWEWASGERWQAETAVRQAVETVQTIIAGETGTARAISGPATIIFLVAATIVILMLIASLLESVIPVF